MKIYQIDSSGIVKRYVDEVGSRSIREICDPNTGNIVSILRITMAEVASAFSRRCRERTITGHERDDLIASFLNDCHTQYQICEVTQDIVSLAVHLVRRYPLRGYDAVQLAAAIFVNQRLISDNLLPLIFISADERLCSAGIAEGLSVRSKIGFARKLDVNDTEALP